jgi:hypothetical protein
MDKGVKIANHAMILVEGQKYSCTCSYALDQLLKVDGRC